MNYDHILSYTNIFMQMIETAEYAKLPIIPPYLQPSADYSHGVNFASGGAGILSTTNPGVVSNFFVFNPCL